MSQRMDPNEIVWPRWLRIVSWLAALVLVLVLLAIRLDDISSGEASTIECLLLVSTLALILVPLFRDIDLFGFRLRQDIQSVRDHVDSQVASLRTEVQFRVQQGVSITQNFGPERDENVRSSEAEPTEAETESELDPLGDEPDNLTRLGQQIPNYGGTILLILCQETEPREVIPMPEFRARMIQWRGEQVVIDWDSRVTFAINWLRYYRLIEILESGITITDRGREVARTRFPGHTGD